MKQIYLSNYGYNFIVTQMILERICRRLREVSKKFPFKFLIFKEKIGKVAKKQ